MKALRVPTACGIKIIEIVQLPPAATLLPHVVLALKSPAFAPVTPTLVIDEGALPELETLIVWVRLVAPTFRFPNVKIEGARSSRPSVIPVPARETMWGEPFVASLTTMEADRAPTPEGVKTIDIVQLPPTPIPAVQLFARLKSLAFEPVTATLVIGKGILPELKTMTVWTGLVVPTFWLLNTRDDGLNPITAGAPVPPRATVSGEVASNESLTSDKLPVWLPKVTGANAIATVQLAPGASTVELEQSARPDGCCLKLADRVTARKFVGRLPMFSTVIACVGLVEPTIVSGKLSVVGAMATLRMTLLALSAMYRFRAVSKARPEG
jgi:hypothetical protein